MKSFLSTCLFLIALLMQGCATITTGTDQTVTIETDPSGAVCKLVRDNETLGIVNTTPGSLTISKDKDEVEISCELTGHLTTVTKHDSNFQGATLGNIIIGGGVGVAIDAFSGAMNSYPSSIQIRLQPEKFSSNQARDEYFDKLVTEVKNNTDTLAQGRDYSCSTKPCKDNLKRLNTKMEEQLAKLEAERNQAVVAME